MVAFSRGDENLIARLRGVESYLVPAGYSTRIYTVSEEVGLQGCLDVIQTGQADGILLTGAVT